METPAEPQGRTVTVGADGSAAAYRAVRWAALEAARTTSVLRIVHVWSVPAPTWTGVVTAAYLDPADLEEGARRIVERAWSSVQRDLGDRAPQVEQVTMQGGAAAQLLAGAADTSLLVVGTRGRGGFASLVLGSVAATCAHHTPVPLAVIGADAPDPGSGEIVVGLDDSPGGRAALRWAIDEGARMGVGVRVVHGWRIPVAAPMGAPTFEPLQDPDLAESAQHALEAIVAEETAGRPDRPPVGVVTVPLSGPEALIEEARHASLLVVGSRGRGGFLGLLLGSVSQHCLYHSPCPLVIVPVPHPGAA